MEVEAATISVIASTSLNQDTSAESKNETVYNMRSTRRSISRSSTTSNSSTSSTANSQTLKTRNRVKLKRDLSEDENGVKFELGSVSNESISTASVSSSTQDDETQNENDIKSLKSKRTNSKRKSLQLINNKSNNNTNEDIDSDHNNHNLIINKKPALNNIQEELLDINSNSENLKQQITKNSQTPNNNNRTNFRSKKIVKNLDENTLDGFNTTSTTTTITNTNTTTPTELNNKKSSKKSNHINPCLINENLTTKINSDNSNKISNDESNQTDFKSLDDQNSNFVNDNNDNKNSIEKYEENSQENIEVDIEGESSNSNEKIDSDKDQNQDTQEELKSNDKNEASQDGQLNMSNPTQEVKIKGKRGRRRTSVMIDPNSDNLKNGFHITVSNLFVYKWPIEDEEDEAKDKDKDKNDQSHQDDDTSSNETKNLNKIFLSSTTDDLYILQEQVSEYLGVKSFKRKYPDIYRRFIDIKEREYLKKHKVVTETQCDLGLTALKLSECFDLMADDYPDKYKEFNDYFSEKRRRVIAAAALQAASNSLNKRKPDLNTNNPRWTHSRAQMSESDRMKEMIKKAMKSVASYNSQLQKEKQEERSTFYDLQTMRIQAPYRQLNNKSNELFSNNIKGQYPVALLPGQFQYHYKKYNSDELKHLPLDTIIYQAPTPEPLLFSEWKRQLSKPPTLSQTTQNSTQTSQTPLNYQSIKQINEASTARKLIEIKPAKKLDDTSDDEDEKMDFTPSKSLNETPKQIVYNSNASNNQSSSIRITASAAPTIAKLINSTNKICYVCQKGSSISTNSIHIDNNQLMISCSSCPRFSHPNCLELNPKLVDWTCIRNYDWQCMECKKCSKCNNPNDEDKMMFCDRCDRGFHTYCVGMSQVPTGSWLCKSCNEFNEKLNAIQEKINQSKQVSSSTSNRSDINTPSRLSTHLKPLLNNSLTTPVSTPLSEKRGRGRPPGSLNKPKDPNSPKKQLKKEKTAKLRDSLLGLNHSINNNQNSLIHNQYEEFNDSLTYDNSYEQYGFLQMNSNSTNNISQTFFHLDETTSNSQYQYS